MSHRRNKLSWHHLESYNTELLCLKERLHYFFLATHVKQTESITNSISRFLSTVVHKGNLGIAEQKS